MAEYVVPICGGLGDAILRYLLPGDCGYIADLKRKEPDAKVRCALASTNPQSVDFLAPLFDAMDYEPWDGDHASFLRRTSQGHIDRTGLRWERPEIFLTDDERRLLDGLGPFVALHPFAGTSNRDWSARIGLRRLVDQLCDEGLAVVMLGGSSERADGPTRRALIERFEMQRPGLVNLVNRGSVRLQAAMAMRAARFVGSFSCYHCAAFAADTPTLVLAEPSFRAFFENEHPVYGRVAGRERTHIHYFDDRTHDRIVSFSKGLQ